MEGTGWSEGDTGCTMSRTWSAARSCRQSVFPPRICLAEFLSCRVKIDVTDQRFGHGVFKTFPLGHLTDKDCTQRFLNLRVKIFLMVATVFKLSAFGFSPL